MFGLTPVTVNQGMGWLALFMLFTNQLFVILGAGGLHYYRKKSILSDNFREMSQGEGGPYNLWPLFKIRLMIRYGSDEKIDEDMHLCSPTQLRLFPPRTCCVSSSRRNPNWTTWWVLDVSKISNSAWIERTRVSRNQRHINFYQNLKHCVFS